MIRRILVFAVPTTMLVVFGCFWAGSGAPAAIVGYVYDDDTGEGIAGAEVVLMPANVTVQTAADGSYRFDNLPAGNYTVRASAAGYQRTEKRGLDAPSGRERWAKLFLKRVSARDDGKSGGK